MITVNATLLHDPERDRDLLRFFSENAVDVELTATGGAESFKKVFVRLLELLLRDDVTINYEKEPSFKPDMYDDVCREYISALNAELISVRRDLISEEITENNPTM